ncbi:MAG TPA: cytoplasmic protein [Methylomirabilota bacterium]|nr:cytoplasmic protein [Methylomirabilota bacterium]
MSESFKEFEASSLFCPRCRQATAVRKKLLLVLPTGNKYDYTCSVCGSAVGGKTDNDATDFYTTPAPPVRRAKPPRLG